MTRLALIPAIALLTACATPRPPAPVATPMPVSTPCVTRLPAPPQFAGDTIQADTPLDAATAALLADRRQRMAYEAELQAILEACIK